MSTPMLHVQRSVVVMLCGIAHACNGSSDQGASSVSTTLEGSTDGGSTTGGTGDDQKADTTSASSITDGEVEITECPTSGGDWEPTQEIPDASGWEEVTVRGIYRLGSFETFPFKLTACEGTYPERQWCVFWNTRPLRGGNCRANIQVRGRLSDILTPETQCGNLGDYYDRALIIDEVLDVGPCDLGNCDAELEEGCRSNPGSKDCKWPCKETIPTDTSTTAGIDTETSETDTTTGMMTAITVSRKPVHRPCPEWR